MVVVTAIQAFNKANCTLVILLYMNAKQAIMHLSICAYSSYNKIYTVAKTVILQVCTILVIIIIYIYNFYLAWLSSDNQRFE